MLKVFAGKLSPRYGCTNKTRTRATSMSMERGEFHGVPSPNTWGTIPKHRAIPATTDCREREDQPLPGTISLTGYPAHWSALKIFTTNQKWTQQVLFIYCTDTYYAYTNAYIDVAIIKKKTISFGVEGTWMGTER